MDFSSMTKTLNWYKALPKWKKVLMAIPVLLVLLVVVFVSFISARDLPKTATSEDVTDFINSERDSALDDIEDVDKELDKALEEARKSIAAIEAKVKKVEEKHADAKDHINNADSFDDIDTVLDYTFKRD